MQYFSQGYAHINVGLDARFPAFMLSSNMVFIWWRKTGMLIIFFTIYCICWVMTKKIGYGFVVGCTKNDVSYSLYETESSIP